MEAEVPSQIPWRALVPLALTVMVAFGVILYGFSIFVTDEAAGSVFSTTVLSAGYGGSVIAGGALAIPIGRHVDRAGIRGIVGLGGILGALGMIVFASADASWHVLAAWWLLLGPAGAMMFYEVAFIAVDQWCAPQHRPKALGTVTLIGGLAGIMFIPAIAWLVEAFGWRSSAYMLGGLIAATALPTAGFALRGVAPPSQTIPSTAQEWPLRGLLRDRRFLVHTAAMVLTFFAAQGLIAHRVALFEEAGFDVGVVALWAAAASAFSLPGRWLAPLVAVRFGAAEVQASATAVLAVATLLMLDGDAGWQMVGHFTLFGIAFGAVLPLRAMTMAVWFSGPGYGSTMGTQWSITTLVGASGPFVVGLLRDATADYSIGAITLLVALLAGGWLLAVSARLRGPEGDKTDATTAPTRWPG